MTGYSTFSDDDHRNEEKTRDPKDVPTIDPPLPTAETRPPKRVRVAATRRTFPDRSAGALNLRSDGDRRNEGNPTFPAILPYSLFPICALNRLIQETLIPKTVIQANKYELLAMMEKILLQRE